LRPQREAWLVFAAGVALAALLFQLGRFIPFVDHNLQALIAAVFIYLPVWVAHRRREELAQLGFTLHPFGRSLAFAGGTILVIFPLFAVAFVLFFRFACDAGLTAVAPAALCPRLHGFAALLAPRAPPDLLSSAFAQLVVVALPEELFFRGFLHERLERAYPPARRLLGGGVGVALLLSSLMFGAAHVVTAGPLGLSRFFPGLLFGWLRSATRSIVAGTIVHAASNLYIDALHRTFFP
jgi:CAAX protease family protein